jgi:hypothetical protein
MRAAVLTIALAFAVTAPASAATQSQVYRDSKDLCSLFTPAQVAKEYHAKSHTAKAAARAYADGYRRPFRESAYRGCLAGFKARH